MQAVNEKPGIEESYVTANNTSNLLVQENQRGAADILIAAGWSESRLGVALLRLHSEWDAAEKPPKPTPQSIHALVGTFQRLVAGQRPSTDKPKPLSHAQAKAQATEWHHHEVGLLLGKLKTLPEVREQVILKALRWGMGKPADPVTRADRSEGREQEEATLNTLRRAVEDSTDQNDKAHAQQALDAEERRSAARRVREGAEDYERAAVKAAGVIRYWLNQTCHGCHGLKWEIAPGTPALSGRPCKVCRGSGFSEVPHQQEGRKLANYLDDCVSRARQALGNRLRNSMGRA